MLTSCWQLPSEVWVQVLGLLCGEDRLRVRAVCKSFRELVDSSRLWRDWTVTLRRTYTTYNKHFWRTLRRWRVSSAALLSCPLSWASVAAELPQLTTLILEDDSHVALESLKYFCNLERLCLRRTKGMSLHNLLGLLPPRLVHLSVCDVFHNRKCVASFIIDLNFNTASHLTNLSSLVLHTSFRMHPQQLLPLILSSFPQLASLSLMPPSLWGFSDYYVPEPDPPQHRSLTSLEVIDNVCSLPGDVMKRLPCLRSLALFFDAHEDASRSSPLGLWLKDLAALTSLLVVGGPAVHSFLSSIPSSVTRLTLRPGRMSAAEMKALSAQLPNLRHLHLEPRTFLGPDTALVPRLFPGLLSLRLRHEQVPEEAFLSLASMTELGRLELQDPVPPRPQLVRKLKELTQDRVRICRRPERDCLWTDTCVNYLPTVN